MVVLKDHPEISVVVRLVGGRVPLQEYHCPSLRKQPEEGPSSTLALIQSLDDAEFSVDFTVDDTEDVADGGGRACDSVDRAITAYDSQSGHGFMHKFRFPIVEKVRDGRRRHPAILESTTGEWGLIEVSVTRVPLHNQPDSLDRVRRSRRPIAVCRFMYCSRATLEKTFSIPALAPAPSKPALPGASRDENRALRSQERRMGKQQAVEQETSARLYGQEENMEEEDDDDDEREIMRMVAKRKIGAGGDPDDDDGGPSQPRKKTRWLSWG
ncbi:hypothetical protein PG996_008875 [Apiospora saccharicola]|uniref:Uncharacterized protein n=1 Tax=Apiospora saccharicola TaxID=335842 RepID=A0ABR1UZ82_9PEZI